MSHKEKKLSSNDKAAVLKVVCPRCGAWVREGCMHTLGSKAGQPCEPHKERIKLANVKLSPETEKKIEAVHTATSSKEEKRKTPKDKLDPEQSHIVDLILTKVTDLGKNAEFVGPVTKGPIISTYRFNPLHRTKVAHLEGLWKDLAVVLGAETLVVKRMPGESAVGVFVPNKERQIIKLTDTLKNVMVYNQGTSKDGHRRIPLNFGITANGDPFVDDLTTQPHLLIAGSTDGGKSTLVIAFLLSMMWAMSPDELQLIICDTKKVDFKPYFGGVPHLAFPIATDQFQTMAALTWANRESNRRIDMLSQFNTRNIHEFNSKYPEKRLPFLVIYIDELADIMGEQVDRNEAKANSQKLGALVGRCRAAGIYVIAGTQRSSVNVIKGSIKANFPSRVAFRLPTQQDSRTIIASKGAENLMSRGDMFYSSSQSSELRRLHSPFTELDHVKELISAIIQKEELRKKKLTDEESERIAIRQEGNREPIDVVSGKDAGKQIM